MRESASLIHQNVHTSERPYQFRLTLNKRRVLHAIPRYTLQLRKLAALDTHYVSDLSEIAAQKQSPTWTERMHFWNLEALLLYLPLPKPYTIKYRPYQS